MQQQHRADREVIASGDHQDFETVTHALTRVLLERLPDDVVAAAIWSRSNPAHLLAVSPSSKVLYRLWPERFDRHRDREAVVSVTGHALNPGECSMTASIQWIGHREVQQRRTRWRFLFGSRELTFDSVTGTDIDEHSAEDLATALAETIGAPIL